GLARFLAARYRLNLKAGFEYRASFWSQVVFMMANNAFMIWFWQIFFQHFGRVRDWGMEDMYLLMGMSTFAFGLANIFAGSALDLAGSIADGELDYFISVPPPTLLHALTTRLRVSTVGDLAFGAILLTLLFGAHPQKLLLALALCVPAAIVFVSFAVIASSMGFFIGESRGITFQVINLLVALSTYPETIFRGNLRWVLYVVIPAGLFTHLPAEILRRPFRLGIEDDILFIKYLGGSLAFLFVSIWIFQRGLRRYASGNSLGVRI
ncbi:MAG: ABC transporter permease, partial [Bdellovibrionota bacterium]